MHINIFMSSYAYVGVSSYIGNFNINHLTRNKRRKTFSRSKFLAICKGGFAKKNVGQMGSNSSKDLI